MSEQPSSKPNAASGGPSTMRRVIITPGMKLADPPTEDVRDLSYEDAMSSVKGDVADKLRESASLWLVDGCTQDLEDGLGGTVRIRTEVWKGTSAVQISFVGTAKAGTESEELVAVAAFCAGYDDEDDMRMRGEVIRMIPSERPTPRAWEDKRPLCLLAFNSERMADEVAGDVVKTLVDAMAATFFRMVHAL